MKKISLIFLTETWLDNQITDSEIFPGGSHTVISPLDKKGGHGRVLIAASSAMFHLVFDLSQDSYPFSAACAVVQIEKAVFFIVVYRPPPSSKFFFSNHILMESISFYINNFNTFCLKRGLNSNFELYDVGVFNMPKVAWACLSSSSSSNNVLLDFFNQIINEATHIRGNCLDLIFISLESIPFHLPK